MVSAPIRKNFNRQIGRPSTITLYPDGVETFCGDFVVQKRSQIGGARGKIKEWSVASRRRMRNFMLQNEPPKNFLSYGLTITIPGPVVSSSDARKYFEHFSHHYVQARDWCMVWRVEKQERGQFHWHCIISGQNSETSESIEWEKVFSQGNVVNAALDALDILGKVEGVYEKKINLMSLEVDGLKMTVKENYVKADSRKLWPGANLYAVKCESADSENGAWKRYLQDHASKAKQSQIAGVGRQWGIVGRKHYQRVDDLLTATLTREEYAKVMRGMRRMFTPRIKDEKSVFGCKLGFKSKRGSRGRSVWFSEKSKREAVARLIADAQSNSKDESFVSSEDKKILAKRKDFQLGE